MGVDIGPGGDICDHKDLTPLGIGTVRATINHNEGEFFMPGANAFLIRFVGTVTDSETGQRYHLQGSIQIVVLPYGTSEELPSRFLSAYTNGEVMQTRGSLVVCRPRRIKSDP